MKGDFMAVILPFRAVRSGRQWVAKVASYPYDILSSEEARKIAAGNPLSFLHVTKAEIDLPADMDPYDDRVYDQARRNFESQLRAGVLTRDDRPCFYVYGLTMEGQEQWGIGACVHAAEFEAGRVKRHELTLPEKETDRMRHIDRLNAQTGPILMAYRSRDSIHRLISRIREKDPEYDFLSDNGVSHALWVVRDAEQIRSIAKEFEPVEALYIADGHHRAAAGMAVAAMRERTFGSRGHAGGHRSVLAVLFPHDQLRIRDYNRVVQDLGGWSMQDYLSRVEKSFEIETDCREKMPRGPREFGMYLGGKWFRLRSREGTWREGDVVGSLDVAILQNNLLGPVLGIRDPRGDTRIRFVGGSRGASELERMVDTEGFAVAFSLFPPTMDQMMNVADAGMVMPPKSTWFEPKLRDGILVHVLNDYDEDPS
jgi:uncharacterized protein (DUF1015 family)